MLTTDTSILDTPSRTAKPMVGYAVTATVSMGLSRSASLSMSERSAAGATSAADDWATDSGCDNTSVTGEKDAVTRDAHSQAGPQRSGSKTSLTLSASDGSAGGFVGVGRVSSVRRRLSLLKLGRKASKVSVLVDSVVEE